VPRKPDGGEPGRRPLIDDELAEQLLGRAQAEGAELLGPDGLLSQLTKAVLERALAEELTGHLGYDKHDPAGRGSGNSRNGATPKTVLTDVGAVDLAVPRDRNGSFEPQIVRKGPDPAGRVRREDHRAVCAQDDRPGHPGAPAADV
jgi:Transposase, Mutator family